MSPAFYSTQAWVGIVTRNGKIDATTSNQVKEVRPVINLNGNVKLSGTGTYDNVYEVVK